MLLLKLAKIHALDDLILEYICTIIEQNQILDCLIPKVEHPRTFEHFSPSTFINENMDKILPNLGIEIYKSSHICNFLFEICSINTLINFRNSKDQSILKCAVLYGLSDVAWNLSKKIFDLDLDHSELKSRFMSLVMA